MESYGSLPEKLSQRWRKIPEEGFTEPVEWKTFFLSNSRTNSRIEP